MVKIILLSIIKNEEKIIERCITSVLSICDAICITDTGSTDNTCNIVETLFINKNITGKLYHDEWKNFGYNRTNAFKNGQEYCRELGWDLNTTYGLLLDADMKLEVVNFTKDNLKSNGYKIIQQNTNIEYYNVRFVKLGFNWHCVGVTHEYWDGCQNDTLTKDIIYINDIGDGGSKNDKFERDIRLLTKGLENEPNNVRYVFYLAQSLKDTGKFKEAIKRYKQRIKMGGWYEEVWYSYYMISKCWLLLKDENKFECWANKAYNYRNLRAEPIYELTKYFRECGKQVKSYHYYLIGKKIEYPKDDSLFIEKNVYNNFVFDYEYTIIQYYVFPNERIEGMKKCIEYLNKYNYNEGNVYSNIDHYMPRLLNYSRNIPLQLESRDDYIPTSTSLIKYNNQIIANVRYVNYRIQNDGSYVMSKNNILSRDEKVRTENSCMILNNNFESMSNLIFMNVDKNNVQVKDTHILGLEDIRLFEINNTLQCIATSREFSDSDTNRIVIGNYDIEKNLISNLTILKSPKEIQYNKCEKNWIPIDDKIIYDWHPLQIGIITNNKLEITIQKNTPTFFKNIRGSSNVIKYNNEYWIVVHGVKYSTPRKYYHAIVILDNEYNIKKYTIPFYFDTFKIEYCLGLLIEDNNIIMSVSKNDSNPFIVKIDMSTINKFII